MTKTLNTITKTLLILLIIGGASTEAFSQKKSKDNQKKYAKNELPEAADSDPELEALMVDVINKHARSKKWKETFHKAIIASEEWYIERNSVTGVILRRNRVAYMVAKWPDGHCSYQAILFYSRYDGTSYSDKIHFAMVKGTPQGIWCTKCKLEE